MNPSVRRGWLLLTPFQWGVGMIVVLIVGGLVLVVVRAPSQIYPVHTWFPPGFSWISWLDSGAVMLVPKPLTNASGWYQRTLGASLPGPGASFMYSHRGLVPFSRKRDIIGTFATGGPTEISTHTYLTKSDQQEMIVQLSQEPGGIETVVRLYRVLAGPLPQRAGPVMTTVEQCMFPQKSGLVSTTSGSNSGDISFRSATINTNFDYVRDWYSSQLGLSKGTTNTLMKGATVSLLPAPPGVLTNESVFLVVKPDALLIINVGKKSARQTSVLISGINR